MPSDRRSQASRNLSDLGLTDTKHTPNIQPIRPERRMPADTS